jgi:hypothetical protein
MRLLELAVPANWTADCSGAIEMVCPTHTLATCEIEYTAKPSMVQQERAGSPLIHQILTVGRSLAQ